MTNPPELRCLLVCERIVSDSKTGMISLFSVFNRIVAGEFPHAHLLSIYVALVDGRGQVPVEIKLTNLDTQESYCSFQGVTRFVDPIEPAHIAATLAATFPAPGIYGLEFHAGGSLMGIHRLKVEAAPAITGTVR